jgi:alpha-D-ribose 1-methylphosphonate 5-triphosphate synthase subunit PhnG
MFRRALGLKHCMIKSITMRLQIGAGMKRFGFSNNSSQERHHSSATSMISQQLLKQNQNQKSISELQKTFDTHQRNRCNRKRRVTVASRNGTPQTCNSRPKRGPLVPDQN